MNFTHEKCKKNLIFDISPLYVLKCPSISISPKGALIELAEIQLRKKTKESIKCYCTTCNSYIDLNEKDSILSKCIICQKEKPIETLYVSSQLSCICEECMKLLIETPTKAPEYIKKVKSFISFSKEIEFVRITDILINKLFV